MNFEIEFTTQFKKDYKRIIKQNKDTSKLYSVISLLASGEKLNPVYKDHKLTGLLKDLRDCHIEPDCVLIYKLNPGLL
ncbi:MAG: type II toxin-antitoxin system YafQ family toxin, partial [Melioribacteraceae bacterium]|nr:type II toxin-antitoxin system YafQ family toxin [Melioribacteraceae bacterium]